MIVRRSSRGERSWLFRLSIVVIAYNMPREIPRTILSLSPSMQVGVARGDYEVLIMDNGSTHQFDVTRCMATGVDLRVEFAGAGDSSPCRSINRGLALRGAICAGS